MRKSPDRKLNRDLLKFACFIAALFAAAALFFFTPALTLPSLCSVVLVTLLSPWVTAVERRGFSRNASIQVVFGLIALITFTGGWLVARSWQQQWVDFQANAPVYIDSTLHKVSVFEAHVRQMHPLLKDVHYAERLSTRGNEIGAWFGQKISGYLSDFFSCLFLVPIITFCVLSEGRMMRRKLFQLVPNRFFESVYIVMNGVLTALSDYLRAKLIEAFLVGGATAIGLVAVQSPYAIVLGIWAGITNIIPYIGPVIGAVPAILLAATGDDHSLIWKVALVYAVSNLFDMLIIFPGIVAKLVNLNPLLLIASVVIGQYYYGMTGMLISIPIVAAIKVVLGELYLVVYGFTPDPDL